MADLPLTEPSQSVSTVPEVVVDATHLSEELFKLFGSNDFGIRLERRLVQSVLQEFGHLEADLNELALFFFLQRQGLLGRRRRVETTVVVLQQRTCPRTC